MRFSPRLVASLAFLSPLLAFAQEAGGAAGAAITTKATPKAANVEDGAGGAPATPIAGEMPHSQVVAGPLAPGAPPPPAQTSSSEPPAPTPSSKEPSTKFNGVDVPAQEELTGNNFEARAGKGYWLVKYYSPYCPHCKRFAPVWQTMYEFYYTSKPVTGSAKDEDLTTSLNSFERYYDFHFANVNCVAWGDMCDSTHKVLQYPTVVLFKDGKEIKRVEGEKTEQALGNFIEECLESIKPGSRPRGELAFPTKGATTAPPIPVVTGVPTAARAVSVRASSTRTVSKPTSTPNLAGTSVELDPDSFSKLVTLSQEPWFIKFYAPWCHHCQQLAPNWQQMARSLKGKLNVGSVNCDQHRRLCQDVHVKAYPTIHFFRGGERVEYNGLRGLGDLVDYANKAVDIGMGVSYVTAEDFKTLEETEEVIFVYFYDHATTSEDFAALERLTLSLVGHAKLVKTDSKSLAERFKIHTWPKLVVSRDGRPSYYNALAPKDMRDFRQVLNWMQTVWLPLVPELTASNAHEIMDNHMVVLAILSPERPDEFEPSRNQIKNAAKDWMTREIHAFQSERAELRESKQLRIEEAEDRGDRRGVAAAKNIRIEISEESRRQVRFAWVNGGFWERWLRTTYGIQIKDGERVVIIDENNKRYWDQTVTGEPIRASRTSIGETLKKVTSDSSELVPKYTTNKVVMFFLELRRLSRTHPWLATIVFLAAIFVVATWGRGRIRRSRGGSSSGGGFHILGEKDGLLGSGSAVNGKSD